MGTPRGDAWRERCDAARRDSPLWRSNYLARGLAGKLLHRRRRRACHEHPDKDARNGKRYSWGTRMKVRWSDCSGTRATRETVRP